MKSFLILSFLFYLKASIISNFIKNEDRETKLIQAIIVTKEITNCLTRTKIIPKTIIDTIKAQKTIIVTEDFEYLSDSQYNNFTRDLINSGINFCINENEGLSCSRHEHGRFCEGRWDPLHRAGQKGSPNPENYPQRHRGLWASAYRRFHDGQYAEGG